MRDFLLEMCGALLFRLSSFGPARTVSHVKHDLVPLIRDSDKIRARAPAAFLNNVFHLVLVHKSRSELRKISFFKTSFAF